MAFRTIPHLATQGSPVWQRIPVLQVALATTLRWLRGEQQAGDALAEELG
jgi:hypothetical protein